MLAGIGLPRRRQPAIVPGNVEHESALQTVPRAELACRRRGAADPQTFDLHEKAVDPRRDDETWMLDAEGLGRPRDGSTNERRGDHDRAAISAGLGSLSGGRNLEPGVVALWDLLLVVCVAAPVGAALTPARITHVGFGGYALVIAVGFVVGVCGAWMMNTAGANVAARIERTSEVRERYFRSLYLAAMLWMVLTTFLGGWLSSIVLRLVF